MDQERERLRAQYSYMSNGTFQAFIVSYRILNELVSSGTVNPEQANDMMKLVDRSKGKPNVTEFRRQVYALTDYAKPMELTRHLAGGGPESAGGRPRAVHRPPDPKRAELREQMSWMSDGTFAQYWKCVQALQRLVKARLISYEQAEQIRKSVPRYENGRPNMVEFRRRVRLVEQKIEEKSAIVQPAPLPEPEPDCGYNAGMKLAECTCSPYASERVILCPVPGHRQLIVMPGIDGKKLAPVSVEGNRVRLAWVADG